MAYEYDRRTLTSAEGDSLFSVKFKWAWRLAQALGDRFSKAGGWRAHRIEPIITSHGRGVDYMGESYAHGFTMHASIVVEGHPVMHLHFNAKPADLDNIDLERLNQEVTDSSTSIKIAEAEPMDKIVMAASTFFSKFVPRSSSR